MLYIVRSKKKPYADFRVSKKDHIFAVPKEL